MISERALGTFLSYIEKKPKETIKTVSLRSEKNLIDPMEVERVK